MAQGTIDLTRHRLTNLALQFNITRIRASRDYRRKLTELPVTEHQDIPGIIHRTFRYPSGARKEVACHARVMVAYMRALKMDPHCEVAADANSPYSGSFRTWEQQSALYAAYKAGSGHIAAPPGEGYHETGRALDISTWQVPAVEKAMLAAQDQGMHFYSGASFGDPPHHSFGEVG